MIYIRIGEETKEITMEDLRTQIAQGIISPDTPIQSETVFGHGLWRTLGKTSLYQRIISGKEPEIEPVVTQSVSAWDTPFGTLLSLGKFISGLGWVLVVLGIIVALVAFAGVSKYLERNPITDITATLLGLAVAAAGIMYVASGQLISCIVAIERNTRKGKDLIERLISQK